MDKGDIGNWIKINPGIYQNSITKKRILIGKDWRKNTYNVLTIPPNAYIAVDYKSRNGALSYAKKYMRSHPNG